MDWTLGWSVEFNTGTELRSYSVKTESVSFLHTVTVVHSIRREGSKTTCVTLLGLNEGVQRFRISSLIVWHHVGRNRLFCILSDFPSWIFVGCPVFLLLCPFSPHICLLFSSWQSFEILIDPCLAVAWGCFFEENKTIHQFNAFLTELSLQDIDISFDGILLGAILGEALHVCFQTGWICLWPKP